MAEFANVVKGYCKWGDEKMMYRESRQKAQEELKQKDFVKTLDKMVEVVVMMVVKMMVVVMVEVEVEEVVVVSEKLLMWLLLLVDLTGV